MFLPKLLLLEWYSNQESTQTGATVVSNGLPSQGAALGSPEEQEERTDHSYVLLNYSYN
jgi:hypothetical protein